MLRERALGIMGTTIVQRRGKPGRTIETCAHADNERVDNPPVGLVTPEADRDAGRKPYAHDPRPDPQLSWAGKVEQIRAFRETWEREVHSCLAYLRDRRLLARELPGESGSCFVQIGDENVHRAGADPGALVFDPVGGSGTTAEVRVCPLVKGDVETPLDCDEIVHAKPDDAGAWKTKCARESKAAGFDVGAKRLVRT